MTLTSNGHRHPGRPATPPKFAGSLYAHLPAARLRQSGRRVPRACLYHPPEDDSHGFVAHNFASSACSVCICFSQSGPSAQDA